MTLEEKINTSTEDLINTEDLIKLERRFRGYLSENIKDENIKDFRVRGSYTKKYRRENPNSNLITFFVISSGAEFSMSYDLDKDELSLFTISEKDLDLPLSWGCYKQSDKVPDGVVDRLKELFPSTNYTTKSHPTDDNDPLKGTVHVFSEMNFYKVLDGYTPTIRQALGDKVPAFMR